MSGAPIIAVDAMGGDSAPAMVMQGLHEVRERVAGTRFRVFGDKARLDPLATRYGLHDDESVVLVHTEDVIRDDAKPSQVLRSGRQSSMYKAIEAVAKGEAGAVVSAGNTGALMAFAKFQLKMLSGIERPAIATYFPTRMGEAVMLDLGANVECDARNLMEFAVMGQVFARAALGRERPSVGLLNIGAEALKGHETVRRAATLLQDSPLADDFKGFIEGTDVGQGTVDVVVTDGFTGNVALKTMEGTARLYSDMLKQTFRSSVTARLGYLLSRGALGRLRQRVDPRRYNGAMLLGLDGVVVKSHGGTDHVGFANALSVAVDLVSNRLIDTIREEMARMVPETAASLASAQG